MKTANRVYLWLTAALMLAAVPAQLGAQDSQAPPAPAVEEDEARAERMDQDRARELAPRKAWERRVEGLSEELEEQAEQMAQEHAERWESWADQQAQRWEKWAEKYESTWEQWAEEQEQAWESWASRYADRWEEWSAALERGEVEPEQIQQLLQRNLEMLGEMPIKELYQGILENADGLREAPWEDLGLVEDLIRESIEGSLRGIEELELDRDRPEAASDETLRALERSLQDMRSHLDHTRQELDRSAQQQLHDFRQRLRDLHKIKNREQRRALIQAALEDIERMNHAKEQEAAHLAELARRRQAELEETADQRVLLERLLEEVSREQDQIESRDDEVDALRMEIEALRKDIERLRKEKAKSPSRR